MSASPCPHCGMTLAPGEEPIMSLEDAGVAYRASVHYDDDVLAWVAETPGMEYLRDAFEASVAYADRVCDIAAGRVTL